MTARWKTNQDGMRRLLEAGRVVQAGSGIAYVRFHGDFPVYPYTDLWTGTQSGSAMDNMYVVQTSQRIIERCMLTTTDPCERLGYFRFDTQDKLTMGAVSGSAACNPA